METLNPPKKKPKSKIGRRKQRKRRSSARTRKIETAPDREQFSLLVTEKERENQEDLLNLIVEVGCGGDFSTCTNNTTRQPLPQSTSFSSSMPETAVTSRSKRLRGATTATIGYTDRKTRSTSTCHSNSFSTSSNLFVEGQEEETKIISTNSFSERESTSLQPKLVNNYSDGKNEGEVGTQEEDTADNNVNHYSESQPEQSNSVGSNVVDCTNNGRRRGSNTLENIKSMKSEIKEDEEESDEASKISGPGSREQLPHDLSSCQQQLRISLSEAEAKSLKEENLTNSQSEGKLQGFDGGSGDTKNDGNFSTTIVVQNAAAQIDTNPNSPNSDVSLRRDGGNGEDNKSLISGQRQRGARHERVPKYVAVDSLGSLSSSGGSFSGAKKCKVPENRKVTTLAPMLLMNNLPYMGELTFDTRPRRGRKPKKADICHLISKNYGIHFPNSYTNTPYTGPPSNITSTTPSSLFTSKVSSLQQTLHGKSGSNKTSHKSNKDRTRCSSLVSGCPTAPIVPSPQPPALLPISTSNRFNSPFSNFGNRNGKSGLESQNNCTSQKGDFPGNKYHVGETGQGEEPLNLCVRDDASKILGLQSPAQLNVKSLSTNCSGVMNLKHLLSPSMLCDVQLKPQTNDRSRLSKKSRTFEDGCKKFKSDLPGSNFSSIQCGSGNSASLSKFCGGAENVTTFTAVRDLGLVNQLNFQINLAKCAHLPLETSIVQSREAGGGFVNANSTGSLPASRSLVGKGEGKRSGRRKGSHLKIKKEALSGESLSNYHVPTTTGGSLFGQTDSGSNSGAQVSICKFKFTGGAKPSLQEKKMLSVDSGGNFRFYTDKDKIGSYSSIKSSKSQGISHSSPSTSGFGGDGEIRQREKDHQQGVHYAYSALPKSAKSMSVCMPVRPFIKLPDTPNPVVVESAGNTNKLTTAIDTQQGSSPFPSNVQHGAITPTVQELNNLHLDSHGRLAFPSTSTSSFSHSQYPYPEDNVDGYSSSQSSESGGPSHSHTGSRASLLGGSPSTSSGHFDAEAFKTRKLLRLKRKRRTRKSLMREKLEKTFKEKGFLIQTQQLESAEGATYCKFRQLRKFTRYLFRSWKDYLPDNVKEINNSSAQASGGVLLASNSEGLQTEWLMSNNPETTPPGNEYNCDEDADEDDSDDEDVLVPEVTLITQPSTPATIVDVDEEHIACSEEGNESDQDVNNDDNDDDVDVEQIDDRGGEFSDNHNSP